MKYKKLMLVTFLLLAILTVSAVSADENATADIAEIDDAVEIDNEINDDVLGAENTDVLTVDNKTLTFGDLTRDFKNATNNEIYLQHDYIYIGPEYSIGVDGVKHLIVDKNGIYINSTLTIHGNGHTIDADGAARIFTILGHNVVLKDINFVNGYSDNNDYGTISWNTTDGTISNCSFTNCHARSAGGAIYWNSVRGNVTDCNFTNCYSDKGGAIYWNGYGSSVTNCRFENTYSTNHAGAIYWESGGGKVSECSFINCSSGQGGGAAIKMMGADGIVTNCTFDKCRGWDVSWDGSGPIDWRGARGKVSNCTFKDTYSGRAGAIYWEGVNGTVNNCNFDNCSEDCYGTIFWNAENGNVTDCNFSNSHDGKSGAGARGAAIWWNGAKGIVANSNFINCTSAGGGAINWDGVNGTIDNSNFLSCYAEEAGAVRWAGEVGTLSNSTFISCYADKGGAVFWPGDKGILSDSYFLNCSAKNGGAIFWNTGTNSNCTFINCSAKETGGAVHWLLSVGAVYDCTFFNCSANGDGGALYDQANLVYGSAYGNGVHVYNSNFINNSAYNGGAYKTADSKGNVIGCIFINNSASNDGGAIASVRDVIDCTFINNTANGRHSGAIDSPYDVINCSFYNCSAMEHGGAIKSASNVINSSFYNCSAKSNGGAIYEAKEIINSSFNDCYATESGAIHNPSSVINCTFDKCISLKLAGALSCYKNRIVVNNSNFKNCLSVNGSAGAIYWSGELGVLSYSNFINCSSNERGGAIYWYGRDGIMRDSNFTNCSADYGGAISAGSARDCTFYGNTATTEGNNWYDTSVPKLYLTVPNLNSTYGFDDALFFNATNADGIAVNDVIITVRVYKNDTLVGEYDVLTNKNWTVGLDAGNYTAKMAIEHHAYVFNKAVTVTLEIAKMPTNITSDPVLTVYNADGYLVAALKDVKGNPVVGMPISVDLNGIQNVTSDENGQINISTKGLPSNVYSAVISFNGTSNYANSSAIVNVTVEKVSSAVSASAVTTVYNGGKYLVVTLKDANGNPIEGVKVSININGAKSATTDANGQAKVTTNGYAPKTYNAKIAFAGDDNYINSSATAKVTVKKATPKLTAKAKTFKRSVKTKKYTVTLKTNQNKVMKNTKVTIKVNKKTYTAKTNSKGVATFKITKLTKKGKYTATVKYAGSKYYNAKSVKVKITVK